MRKLYVNIDAIIDLNTNELLFERDVIHNLYYISKQLNYGLIIIGDFKASAVISKAFDILKNESIAFEALRQVENIETTYPSYISKKNLTNWNEVLENLKSSRRKISHSRNTHETRIDIELNLDGTGVYRISTGLGFFDHMLEQLSKHSLIDLTLNVKGDLQIDEHHTIEDTAIALGEAMLRSLEDKKGMNRYGFLLPMDDCLAQVAIDFGGRSWLVWEAEFKREKIGDVPTEMFYHFFKSFSDAAKCNLNIKAEGVNEHHKIESIFKAFAKAIKMAITVNYESNVLPTTKGIL